MTNRAASATLSLTLAPVAVPEYSEHDIRQTQLLADWQQLDDAALIRHFDYEFLLENNCDLWLIEHLSPGHWLAYAQFISFRFTVTLYQADIDKLNMILGWQVGEADYLPEQVYHYFIPSNYDVQTGLTGIAALWRNHIFLSLPEIEAELEATQANERIYDE